MQGSKFYPRQAELSRFQPCDSECRVKETRVNRLETLPLQLKKATDRGQACGSGPLHAGLERPWPKAVKVKP